MYQMQKISYNAMLKARPTTASTAAVLRTIGEESFETGEFPVDVAEGDGTTEVTKELAAGALTAGAAPSDDVSYGLELEPLEPPVVVELPADDPIAAAWKAAKVLSAEGLIANTIPC